MLPEIGLAKGACSLWQEDQFLDYTIEVEDEHFKVHKLVMASVSDYFRAMLTGGLKESKEDRVRLEGLCPLAVKNIIEYVYTGKIGSSKASAEERLTCAMYFQIPAAVKLCAASLCEEVNKKNCFRIMSIFHSYGIKHSIEHTAKFMKQNFEDILEVLKCEDLTLDQFRYLIDCWGRPEGQLFAKAMEWLRKKEEHRKEYLYEIMSHLRFYLMSPAELISLQGMDIISDPEGPWHELIEKALIYHNLPIHQKVLEESEQAKVRSDPSPVCFGVRPSVSGQLFTVRGRNSWKRFNTANPFLPDTYDRDWPFNFIHINNFCIACINSGEHDVQCSIFDPRTLTWSAMAPMMVPRERCSLVYHKKHLYAFGGHVSLDASQTPTDIIEKYDFHTNTWSVLTSKMPVAMFTFGAFSLGDHIYLPGGWQSIGLDNSPVLYCFDPRTDEWSEKATPPQDAVINCSNRVVVEIDGEQVMASLYGDMTLHYYKPSVDRWLVYDKSNPSNVQFGRFDEGRLHAIGNMIHIVDFNEAGVDGPPDHNMCEKWVFGEAGVQVETVSDHRPREVCGSLLTDCCALLAIP